MEIPRMKILIYVLTFLGYAYSGYGSNVISNLRDAILSAENIFSGVLENVVTVAKKFSSVRDVLDAAVEETCEFKCPSGVTPVPNKFHKPSSDGCGTLDFSLNQFLKSSDITACCNAHDICYDTCNSGKDSCDFSMQRCLYKQCENSNLSETMSKTCKATAKLMFSGTFSLGCKAYLDSQKKACFCAENKRKRHSGGEL